MTHVFYYFILSLFLCGDLAILMPGLASPGANVLPKSSHWHYFARAPFLHPGLSAAQDDCDWFKEIQTRQSTGTALKRERGDRSGYARLACSNLLLVSSRCSWSSPRSRRRRRTRWAPSAPPSSGSGSARTAPRRPATRTASCTSSKHCRPTGPGRKDRG